MDYIEITCLFFFCKIYIQYVLKNYVLELIYVRILCFYENELHQCLTKNRL